MLDTDNYGIYRRPTPRQKEKRKLYRSAFTWRAARIMALHMGICIALYFGGSFLRAAERDAGWWLLLVATLYLLVIFFWIFDEMGKKVEVLAEKLVLVHGSRRWDLEWDRIKTMDGRHWGFPWGRGARLEGRAKHGPPVRFVVYRSTFREYEQICSLVKVAVNDGWRNYLKKMNIARDDVNLEKTDSAISLE